MTEEKLFELFEIHEDEHYQDQLIKNKRHPRSDIAAMLLLHEFSPEEDCRMLSWAGDEEITFDVRVEDVIGKITEDQVVELICYGVRIIDESYFGMFV